MIFGGRRPRSPQLAEAIFGSPPNPFRRQRESFGFQFGEQRRIPREAQPQLNQQTFLENMDPKVQEQQEQLNPQERNEDEIGLLRNDNQRLQRRDSDGFDFDTNPFGFNLRRNMQRNPFSFGQETVPIHHLENALNEKKKFLIIPEPTTSQHWQLKDMLQYPEEDHRIFFTRESMVKSYDFSSQATETVMELSYAPTSLAVGQGFLATGSSDSKLTVRNLATKDQIFHSNIGGSINNGLHISNAFRGQLSIFVANNDETIKVFRLTQSSVQLVHTTNFNVAVNQMSLSYDGKTLVAVTDSHDVFLVDPQQEYTILNTLKGPQDANFSVSWSPDSNYFAVGSQDGCCYIWDIRNFNKVFSIIEFHRQNLRDPSPIRNVKFSKEYDLLLMSEDSDWFSVIDSRSFDARESVHFISGGLSDIKITGGCWSPDSENLFLSTSNEIVKLTVDSVMRRSFPFGDINLN
ncbi:hypothetical protein M0811_07514 [Anaeramoeba ignava]|uniref:DUF2415 domain-containing protein n=1 Tax=Anaeramoeba ignava TaxID=1746090 RepID=A0A9Q0RD20_ANAIG|nr:hypothetical protein M0811_07514 [Anaeramoeba ignava]